MDHSLLLKVVNQLALILRAQGEDVDSVSVKGYEVLMLVQKNTGDLRFPELEALVSENDGLSLLLTTPTVFGNIHDHQVVGVNIDGLETDDDFLCPSFCVSEHMNVSVPNIQLVLPLNEELSFNWVVNLELYNKEPKFLLKFVGKDIKHLVISIIDDFHD